MSAIPLVLLTGFLGSGKTTLLNDLLRRPEFRDTAVIVNEAGEVGVDHALMETSDEDIVLLEGGCVCCRLRGSLNQTLQKLLRRRALDGARIRRVVVETSGLAEPAPILHALLADPLFNRHFELAGVATLVDAANFTRTLANHGECRAQVALADRLLLTKTDLATPTELAHVEAQVAVLNPHAERVRVATGHRDGRLLWLDPLADCLATRGLEQAPVPAASDVQTAALAFAGRLGQADVDRWLDHVDGLFGDALLRLKGILWLDELPEPVVLHGVQGLVYSPGTLPDPARVGGENRMVLIARGIDREMLADALGLLRRSARLPA